MGIENIRIIGAGVFSPEQIEKSRQFIRDYKPTPHVQLTPEQVQELGRNLLKTIVKK